ncbi:MAG: 2-isopropylmalate synthase [Gemmatimonadetes bacterium]|nr:2-isopropylmalate synthase [Gemmatimonadota bacterium]
MAGKSPKETPHSRPEAVVEVMDTTLRDGEQAEGISMMPAEKLTIARQLLEKVRVDRIEVASARTSAGEHDAVKRIAEWAESAGCLDRVEVLGFVDADASADWARTVGARVINLLTKGSLRHCREQLRRTPQDHLDDIQRTIEYGVKRGLAFNVYLEDWSGGMTGSPDYVMAQIETLARMPVRRIMLCDTLGILAPSQVRRFVGQIVAAFPALRFDYHGHNDYGLATANTLEAVLAGARGVHVTVNGMGERAGNTPLDEVVVSLRDHAGVATRVDERALADISRLVEVFSGRRIAVNKPIVGENVFTQAAGVHADGDKKGNLYESRLGPARFGLHRSYAMGKLMGKASLDFNLERLNVTLTKEQKQQLLARIIELSDQKKNVTKADLPFLISEMLQSPELRVFEVKDYSVMSNRGLRPTATVLVRYRDKDIQATGSGDGGYNAFMQALKSIEKQLGFRLPALVDYEVHIPPGGKTDALVETTIKWEGGLKTRGVHSDQLAAAIQATEHALNLIALHSSDVRRPARRTRGTRRPLSRVVKPAV